MERALEIAAALLGEPTAPFVEDRPRARAATLVDVPNSLDAAGNLVVATAGRGAPLVLVAHLDHPGFAVDAVADGRASLTFRGGLGLAAARAGTGVAFFSPTG